MAAAIENNVVSLDSGLAPDNARFLRNERIGLKLIDAGVPVFLVSGQNKTPIWKRFQFLDSDIPPADVARARAEHEKKFGRDSIAHPFVCGSTLDPAKFKKAIRKNRNAVPGIAMGPAGLICIDADHKNNGPKLLTEFYDAHGGFPTDTVMTPTQTVPGFHAWYKNEKSFPTSEALKSLGTDVKAVGSQCLAPGVLFKSGKSYGNEADCDRLIAAIKENRLPKLPAFVVAKLDKHAARERIAVNVDIAAETARLEKLVWPTYDDLYDEDVGDYSVQALKDNDSVFASIMGGTYAEDNPSQDSSLSTLRFKAAQAFLRKYPDMPVEHLIVFFERYEAGDSNDHSLFGDYGEPVAGESYDLREVIRIRARALAGLENGTAQAVVADTSAFGDLAVVDEGQADEDAAQAQPLKPAAPMGLIWADDIVADWKPMRWMIRDVMPARGVSMIYAPSNVGKSFIALDIAQHVVRGREWFGKRVEQADVAYIYAEGKDGLSGRLKAWADHNDATGGNVAFFKDTPAINKNPQRAVRAIAATVGGMKERTGREFGLLVLDTWSAVISGADQNGSPELNVIIEQVQWLAIQLKCLVCIVHHAGKDLSRGARGGTELPASADTVHTLKVEAGGVISMVCEKSRDGSKGEPLHFRLKTVKIGVDEFGTDVTSCIVVEHKAGGRTNLATDDLTDDEMPVIAAPDRIEDRRLSIVTVIREAGDEGLADGERRGSAPVRLAAGEITTALNRWRKSVGLPVLLRQRVSALIADAVDAKLIERKGPNSRAVYGLPG